MNEGKWQRLLLGDHRDPREELAEIFGAAIPHSGDTQPEALDWARNQLGSDREDQLEAVKKLREAEPRLSLKTATYLAERVFMTR